MHIAIEESIDLLNGDTHLQLVLVALRIGC